MSDDDPYKKIEWNPEDDEMREEYDFSEGVKKPQIGAGQKWVNYLTHCKETGNPQFCPRVCMECGKDIFEHKHAGNDTQACPWCLHAYND